MHFYTALYLRHDIVSVTNMNTRMPKCDTGYFTLLALTGFVETESSEKAH